MRFNPMRVRIGLLMVIMTFCVAAWAQDTASITGTVTDASGAAIPNAQVAVSNAAMGISRTAATNGSGDFLFASLPIGSYDLTVTSTGFKKYEAKGVVLNVGEKARVNIALEVGAASTEIIVEGSQVAQVETQSSDLGGTVTGKEITQLELNGRDFKQLITLVPGVSNQTGADEGGVGVTANTQFSVNGGRVEYNNWELDGGDNLDNGSNGTLNVTPSVDAIGEFKVLTSNYGAQFGKNGSGTIEVETKSGTNKFHGDAYEFVRNNMFNSPSFLEDGVAPPYHKNDFGYTVGGPVYIPGVYNQSKSKTFVFWSQEWRRDRVPYTFDQLVPTAAERTGNFTDICGATPVAPYPADCPLNSSGVPFPGHQVPVKPSDPNVNALLSLIPPPTP
ncbi:MAG: carboxypeptidase regulatory-like domain-containing protein, partial [Candidatus Sulfotelmatobacter sp.]